jgi:hypothetical protein
LVVSKEAIDPKGIDGFSHVEENRDCQPLFAKHPGNSFNEADEMHWRAMPGSNPKLLVSHQTAIGYFI